MTWRRGQTKIRRRVKRRVNVDRNGVLRVGHSRRRDAGLYSCHVTAVSADRRRLRSTANTTLYFHQLLDAVQLVEARWKNMEDDVDVKALMRLGPLSYRPPDRELAESYSVTYIRRTLVRIAVMHCLWQNEYSRHQLLPTTTRAQTRQHFCCQNQISTDCSEIFPRCIECQREL